MAKKKKEPGESGPNDIRLEATKMIWGITAALFGMSIPITAMSHTDGPIVPVVTILMATLSTVGVWAFGHRAGKNAQNPQLEELNETITALKNNVAMLEDTLGDELLRRRIEQESSAPRMTVPNGNSASQQSMHNVPPSNAHSSEDAAKRQPHA